MILYICVGFILGCFIPSVSSRFGKFLPPDPGTALACLWHRPRFPKAKTPLYQNYFKCKWRKFVLVSFLWGVFIAAMAALVVHLSPAASWPWLVIFIYILGQLAAVDKQHLLLPDVLTIPLLLLGLGFSFWGGSTIVSPEESISGAMYGYLLPLVSVLLSYPFLRDGFGGGDVKMLTALGAWLGFWGLSITLFLSIFLFTFWAITHRQRKGAYGQHLAAAALITLFLLQSGLIDFL